MVNRSDYKNALKRIDKDIRVCLKYLEGLMEERFKLDRQVKRPLDPRASNFDFSRLESKDDSLQKQINGLKSKVDIANNHIRKHHEQEIFLKKMATRTEEVLSEIKRLYEELYDSGYYSEGMKRKLRDAGLIKKKEN